MYTVRISFPISAERLRKIVDNDRTRLHLAQTAYKYMYEYIPIYTGALANAVDISPKGILFKQLYAENVYKVTTDLHTDAVSSPHTEYESAYRQLGRKPSWTPQYHPKAAHFWDSVMMNDHRDDIIREMKRFIEDEQ